MLTSSSPGRWRGSGTRCWPCILHIETCQIQNLPPWEHLDACAVLGDNVSGAQGARRAGLHPWGAAAHGSKPAQSEPFAWRPSSRNWDYVAPGLRNSSAGATLHHLLHFKDILLPCTRPGASQGSVPGEGLVAPAPSPAGTGAQGVWVLQGGLGASNWAPHLGISKKSLNGQDVSCD